MVLVPLPEAIDNLRDLVNILSEILQRRQRRVVQLPLPRASRRRRPSVVAIAPQLLLEYSEEVVLQRLDLQSRSVKGLAALDEDIVGEALRDARPPGIIDALRQDIFAQ